jgi:glycerol uptake facilitator-like aquaporin
LRKSSPENSSARRFCSRRSSALALWPSVSPEVISPSRCSVLRGDLEATDGAAYVAAQIAGGLIGVFAAHLMFAEPVFQLSVKLRDGPSQWFAEWVATFGLVITVLLALRARASAVPMAVGLYITAAYWFTASTSFANPAVTIARAFSDSFAGIRLADVPAFVAAQLLGAVAGLYLCRWLTSARGVAVGQARSAAE